MKSVIKNIIYNLRVVLAAVTCFVGVSMVFINDSTLEKLLAESLNLKVDPRFVGGPVVADFIDEVGDDRGSGVICYPEHKDFSSGVLDLVRYTVHEPVYDAKWQQNPDYWQMDFEFKKDANPVRNIMVYIGVDQGKSGNGLASVCSSRTLYEDAENISFSPEKPWNIAVQLSKGEGKIYDAEGNFIGNAESYFLNNGKTVKFRIPLKNRNLQKIYEAESTWHYVLVGAYSPYDSGSFMPIEEEPSISRGYVKYEKDYNRNLPKLYDILGDNEQLSDYGTDSRAMIKPVEVKMRKNEKGAASDLDELSAFVNERLAELNPSIKDEYFGFANLNEAMAHYEKATEENPLDPISMCRYGSCLAMKAGESSALKAMSLVKKSYKYLDRAIELSTNDRELFETLLNRANVSKSVPDSIFKKALVGAEDFARAAAIQKKAIATASAEKMEYEKIVLASLFLNSAECYKIAEKETDALLKLQEAKKALE